MCFRRWIFSCVSFFFFKQKTAYEMRISDWSSDVCSSDLSADYARSFGMAALCRDLYSGFLRADDDPGLWDFACLRRAGYPLRPALAVGNGSAGDDRKRGHRGWRSEEHTSELQSLMRISYAVFCLKQKKQTTDRQRIKIDRTMC